MTEHNEIQHLTDIANRPYEEQMRFFQTTLSAAMLAEEQAGVIDRFICVAGVTVRLVFAGSALVELLSAALSHLTIPATDQVDATFHIWDSASTGIVNPAPPFSMAAFTVRGDIRGFGSRSIYSAFHNSEMSLTLYETNSATGIYWINSSDGLPYWTCSSPLRTLFHWLMLQHDKQLIHGAVVGTSNGGVLIVGAGGVGKSTTSLSCLTAGMQFLGDDYVVVSKDPVPTAFCLYSTAKVTPQQLEDFPELSRCASLTSPEDEKAVLYLHPFFHDQIKNEIALRWILVPVFGTTESTSFEAVRVEELHQAAIFTTMAQLPHADLASFDMLDELVHEVPNALLVLGSALQGVPHALSQLLIFGEELAEQSPQPTPLISVVIPVHNGASFLARAIESVLNQHYEALEIIVVDDASTDDMDSVLETLPTQIRVLRQQQNRGPAAARNLGIRVARGCYVAFLDVDDRWTPGHLRSLMKAAQAQPDIAVFSGRSIVIHEDLSGQNAPIVFGNYLDAYPYYIGSALYRKEVFEEIGEFDETMRFGEDTDWYHRLEKSGSGLLQIDRISLLVYRHGENMTHRKSSLELNEALARILKKSLDRRRAESTNPGKPVASQ